jgi:predicted ATP-dependent endonuclease of OLD family
MIGANNIGKTSILKAISLLLNEEIYSHNKRTLSIEDFNIDAVIKFKECIANETTLATDIEFPEVKVTLYFSDFKDINEEAIVCAWYTNDMKNEASLTYTFSCDMLNKHEWISRMREKFSSDDSTAERQLKVDLPIKDYKYKIEGGIGRVKPDSFQLEPLKMDFLDALRDAQRELSASRDNNLLFKVLKNRDESKFDDIKKSAENLNKSIREKSSELNDIKSEISTVLDLLSLEIDDSDNNINFRFSDLSVIELLKKIGLEYGDKPISVSNNGLGRNNLLYMSLVLSHIQSKSADIDFRLIAIEEPEAHINPVLQKHFSESISNANFFNKSSSKQIILTSHSTHISSYIDMENTVVLFHDEGEIKSHYLFDGISNDASGKRTKNYLRKWLSATNSVMFFSKRVIFVEGIAEQLLIPKLFEIHFGKKLEKMNCQVVNVSGIAFKNFLEIIKNGYYIKAAVLTDSDASTKSKNRAPDLKKNYDGDKIFVSISQENTFEKDLVQANIIGAGKTKIKNALKSTRPNKFASEGEALFKTKPDVNEIYAWIEEYKSEFSFDLLSELDKSNTFKIPKYIKDAFDFIGT